VISALTLLRLHTVIIVSTLFFGAIAAFVYVTESAKKAAACVVALTNFEAVMDTIRTNARYSIVAVHLFSETDSGLRAKGVTITESGIAVKLNKPAPTRGNDAPIYI
jgi:hypothetical protein